MACKVYILNTNCRPVISWLPSLNTILQQAPSKSCRQLLNVSTKAICIELFKAVNVTMAQSSLPTFPSVIPYGLRLDVLQSNWACHHCNRRICENVNSSRAAIQHQNTTSNRLTQLLSRFRLAKWLDLQQPGCRWHHFVETFMWKK